MTEIIEKNTNEDEYKLSEETTIRQLLHYIISQHSQRSHGTLDEYLTMGTIKNELYKTCDSIEEQPFKCCPYLTKYKWAFLSFYYALIMLSSLLNPFLLVIIAISGTCIHWCIYGIEFQWIERLLPGVQSLNLFGKMYCSQHDHCFNEKTVLFVSHTDDCYKDKGIVVQLCQSFIHYGVYFMMIIAISSFCFGIVTQNYIFITITSILSLIYMIFSMSISFKGKENKISGLATTSCLLSLAKKLKQEKSSLLQTTNVYFLITTTNSERHSGIRSFLNIFKNQQQDKEKNIIIICLDELDDSDTLCCYKKEGIFSSSYSKTLIDNLQDASQREDICLNSFTNYLYQPFTSAKEFLHSFKEVVPIIAKCRQLKRKIREEKEKEIINEGEIVCLHDDQIKCIISCSQLLFRYLSTIDFVETLQESPQTFDHIEMEMNPLNQEEHELSTYHSTSIEEKEEIKENDTSLQLEDILDGSQPIEI